jgi:hypothetical protein
MVSSCCVNLSCMQDIAYGVHSSGIVLTHAKIDF